MCFLFLKQRYSAPATELDALKIFFTIYCNFLKAVSL